MLKRLIPESKGWGAVSSVAQAPDGKTLAAASDHQAIHTWDIASARHSAINIGVGRRVECVANVQRSPSGEVMPMLPK